MAHIHGCHVTSREAMLLMKYEHYGKCKGSFKDSQRKCKYLGNNCIQIFIWGGISSDIRSEISFYGDASAKP